MSVTFYDAYIKPIALLLSSNKSIIAKAEPWLAASSIDEKDLLLNTRLAPDMLPLAFQFHITISAVTSLIARLRGETPANVDFNSYTSFKAVSAALEAADEAIKSLTTEEVEAGRKKVVELNLGPVVKYETTWEGLILGYSLPNVNFHTVTVYAILRSKGLDLGKADFITPFLGPVLSQAKNITPAAESS